MTVPAEPSTVTSMPSTSDVVPVVTESTLGMPSSRLTTTACELRAMRPLRGLATLAPAEVLVLRERRALRAAGHAWQALLAERGNASPLEPALVEEAGRSLTLPNCSAFPLQYTEGEAYVNINI